MTKFDVIAVGGGNAGFSAAHAAAERGRSVLLIERGERDMAGGNSFYTAGATRMMHDGLDDLKARAAACATASCTSARRTSVPTARTSSGWVACWHRRRW